MIREGSTNDSHETVELSSYPAVKCSEGGRDTNSTGGKGTEIVVRRDLGSEQYSSYSITGIQVTAYIYAIFSTSFMMDNISLQVLDPSYKWR